MHKTLALLSLLFSFSPLWAQGAYLERLDDALREPKENLSLQGNGLPASQLSFNSEGTTLAAVWTSWSKDLHVRVWSATTGKLESRLSVKPPFPGRLALSGDHKFAAVWPTNQDLLRPEPLTLWHMATGREHAVLKHPSYVDDAIFLPDRNILMTISSFASGPKEVKLWDLASGKERPLNPRCVLASTLAISNLIVAPDGSRFVQRQDSGIRDWDTGTGASQVFLNTQHWPLSFSPDASFLLSVDRDNTVALWDMKERRIQVSQNFKHKHGTPVFAFSDDSKLLALTGPNGDLTTIWDVRKGQTVSTHSFKPVFSPPKFKPPVDYGGIETQFTSKGTLAVSIGFAGGANSWDVATGADRGRFPTQRFAIIKGVFSGTRGILTSRHVLPPSSCRVGQGNRLFEVILELCDFADSTKQFRWKVDERMAAFSQKNGMLACAYGNGAIKIWNLRQILGEPIED